MKIEALTTQFIDVTAISISDHGTSNRLSSSFYPDKAGIVVSGIPLKSKID